MSNRVKKRQAEQKAKYLGRCSADGCRSEVSFEAVPYPGIEVVRQCSNCGTMAVFRLDIEDTAKEIYKLRPDKLEINQAITRVFARLQMQIGVRSLFYQLASVEQVIPKTEKAYNVVCNYVSDMRLRGWLAWRCITDESRLYFTQQTYSGIGEALDHVSMSYRKDLWQDRQDVVQIWIEKLGLAGTIRPITYQYDVSLLPVRGYNSLTFLHQTAEEIKEANRAGKRFFIYHFGDYDPSGVNAAETIEDSLQSLGAGNFNFERMAITRQQIAEYSLPTRPTKRSDTRSKGFAGDSCELDALDPRILRDLTERCILNHIDKPELEYLKELEEMERQQLQQLKYQL